MAKKLPKTDYFFKTSSFDSFLSITFEPLIRLDLDLHCWSYIIFVYLCKFLQNFLRTFNFLPYIVKYKKYNDFVGQLPHMVMKK